MGRGLDALLAGDSQNQPSERLSSDAHGEQGTLMISLIAPGRYQPRQSFTQETLEDLAASIKEQGVIQPILVRRKPQGGFELIAGERRWRAAQMAGIEKIPAIIRDVTDKEAAAMALIENIQREDLGVLDEAKGLQRLQTEFSLTQQEVAEVVGRSRTAVTNLIRLLGLVPPVRKMLDSGVLDMGHARALLALKPDVQERAASLVVEKQLSVRQAEALVRQMGSEAKGTRPGRTGRTQKDPDVSRLEREIMDNIGAEVTLDHDSKGKGRLVIRYSSLSELDGILDRLRK